MGKKEENSPMDMVLLLEEKNYFMENLKWVC
jgi:hypothetical protein